MRVLFVHTGVPQRLRQLAAALAANRRHQVVFATNAHPALTVAAVGGQAAWPGPVRLARWETTRAGGEHCHRYLRDLERAVLVGQGVSRLGARLAARGFQPDLVYGEGGSGTAFYAKETFPETRLICTFTAFHGMAREDGADRGPAEADAACLQRARNGATLLDLAQCDRGVLASTALLARFPPDARELLSVIADGVDETWFRPGPGWERQGAEASRAEVVTVAWGGAGAAPEAQARSLAPLLVALQSRRAASRVVLVSDRDPALSPSADTWADHGVDAARLRALGPMGVNARRDLLQQSAAYVHLGPVAASRNVLEAMSCGCLVVVPAAGPVGDLVTPDQDGLVFPARSTAGPGALAGDAGEDVSEALGVTLSEALGDGNRRVALGRQARATVLERHRAAELLARHVRLVGDVASDRATSAPSPVTPGR